MAATTIDSVEHASPTALWLDRPRPDVAAGSGPNGLPRTVDFLVVGAGLTGLWAAVEAAAGGCSVAVVDGAPTVGGGATGRCGGFINASITHGIAHGHTHWPDEMPAIVRLQEALWDDTVRFLIERGAADVIQPCGKLTVATRPNHTAAIDSAVGLLRRYGQAVRRLDRDEVRAEIASPTYLGGYQLDTANGLCDPVALVDTLAAAAVEAGAVIATATSVETLDDEGAAVRALTADGAVVRAGTVLLATNAYPPLWRRLRRRVLPVYDHVIATSPLGASAWESIGWPRRQGVTDAGNRFHYYRPTPEGRILFGGWDATYHFGAKVDPTLERRPRSHRLLARHLLDTFPQLDGIEITHAWGGPIDTTSRFTPTLDTAMGGKLGWAVGFTGLGVGASRFAALAALDLLGGKVTERTTLSMVRRPPIPFPPEPLRYPLVQCTKHALAREDATGRRGLWLRFLDRLGVGFNT